MGIKNKVKRIIGNKSISKLKYVRGVYRYCESKAKDKSSYKIKDSDWTLWKEYQESDKHVFFGYYDIQQLNDNQDKALITKIPLHVDTRMDNAELLWVDLENGEEHCISQTSAWCWQQGARLRWHPENKAAVLFNDVSEGHYITRIWNIDTNTEIKKYPRALYDVTPNMKYGFSLNYSRLQRLRPGYGYNKLPDETIDAKAPDNDGLFRVDLDTNEITLLVSLHDLSEKSPESIDLWNYINHISVSPNGKRLIFFHIWTPGVTARWMVALYSINVDGTDLKCLEKNYRASHYCWMNDDQILITAGGFSNKESRYIIYDIPSGERRILKGKMLKYDGHPTVSLDKKTFVTDTYPIGNNRQILYRCSVDTGECKPILDFFSDSRMFEEKRCDLHPRVTRDGKYISIDTTCRDGKRSVIILRKQ
jgi:hypothetical protein